jgi:putative membrane protein insertion efficiency factor
VKRVLLWIIRGYQFALSPLLGNQCRFAPTCSQYAREAIERHGALRGSWLGLWRLLRCQPWCAGGVDPVPAQFRWQCSCARHAPLPARH